MHISAAYTFLFSTPHPSTRTQRQESLVTPIPTRETNVRYDPSDCVFFSSVGDPAHRSSIPILGNVDEVCIYSVLPSSSGRTAQDSPWVWPGVLTLASWKLVRCEWKLAFGRHRLRLSQPTSSVGVQEEDSHITAIGPTNSRNKCASASAERTQPSKVETSRSRCSRLVSRSLADEKVEVLQRCLRGTVSESQRRQPEEGGQAAQSRPFMERKHRNWYLLSLFLYVSLSTFLGYRLLSLSSEKHLKQHNFPCYGGSFRLLD
ncbi:hypothetical protein GW17_00030432 [Ensete ventricosum]|nr:hypothetical protein GW17_00030432 [Ensete ventricosum]